AKTFLEEKFRADILNGDGDAANELIELVGWEKVEPYLLDVMQSLSEPRSAGFNLAAALLAQRHVQKAVPMIVAALGDRSPSVEGDSRWLSFPFLYRKKLDNGYVATNGWLFGSLVAEITEKRTESSTIDHNSPSVDSTLNFLRGNLKPCEGVFCPSNLGVDGL